MDVLEGFIEHITFYNIENGFTVAKLKNKNFLHTITGIMPSIQPGESVSIEGNWKNHPKFGNQFEVVSYQVKAPSDLLGIQKYLESGLIRGIGPVYAERIVKKFGLDTIKIIDTTPNKLLQIEGIGKKRIEMIKENWEEQKYIREVIIFLKSHLISPSYAQKIYKIYGEATITKIKENPFILAKEIDGIGFKTADNIAQKIGITKENPLRIKSGIEYVLYELTNQGNTCYEKNDFFSLAEKILEVDKKIIENELSNLIKLKEIIENNLNNQAFLWLRSFYNFEIEISKNINRLLHYKTKFRTFDIDKALIWLQKKLNINLAEKQVLAINDALLNKMHIITGGPGTGKSTITKCIIEILKEITNDIILCAPTGRAAKRLSQITNKKAQTIHSLLEIDFKKRSFKKDEHNPLKCDLIIIDEASMIDTFIMHHLIKAIPSYAKIIFIGDIDQLPSVGAGNVLKDLIESNKIKFTKLNEIFRQAKNSNIIVNAHRINVGQMPIFEKEDSDFLFYYLEEPEEIEKKILSIFESKLIKKFGFNPIDDVQVLTPMRKGIIGVENLNLSIQNKLNPSSKPLFRNGKRFHLFDKIMQIKNNYSKNVFNGDIGKIIKIDLVEQKLIVSFDENIISYDFANLDEITLSYAVSVHKYQGSECPCIIMPIHTTHFKLLQKNLLYTAVTRGKKLVILIGTKKAVSIAIKNDDVSKRFTGLKEAIKNQSEKSFENFLFN